MAGPPDSAPWLLLRSGTVAGSYLIIDLGTTPPTVVTADQILPAVLLEKLAEIDEKLEQIRMTQAQYEADISALRDFFTALPGQLDAIRAAMADAAASGVQDLSALDDLANQANSAGAAVGSVVGSPATPDVPPVLTEPIPEVPVPSEQPPADVPADSGSTPDAPPDAPLPS